MVSLKTVLYWWALFAAFMGSGHAIVLAVFLWFMGERRKSGYILLCFVFCAIPWAITLTYGIPTVYAYLINLIGMITIYWAYGRYD
jgi:hypothetical protein